LSPVAPLGRRWGAWVLDAALVLALYLRLLPLAPAPGFPSPTAQVSGPHAVAVLAAAGLLYYASGWLLWRASWAQHWLGLRQVCTHPAQIPARALLWWTNLSGVLWLWNQLCVLRGRPPLYERWSRCPLLQCA